MTKIIFIAAFIVSITLSHGSASASAMYKFTCEHSEGTRKYQSVTIEPFLSDMQCADTLTVTVNGEPFHTNWKCVDNHFRMPGHRGLSQIYTEPWGDTVFLRTADDPDDVVIVNRWTTDGRGNDVHEHTWLKCKLIELENR